MNNQFEGTEEKGVGGGGRALLVADHSAALNVPSMPIGRQFIGRLRPLFHFGRRKKKTEIEAKLIGRRWRGPPFFFHRVVAWMTAIKIPADVSG